MAGVAGVMAGAGWRDGAGVAGVAGVMAGVAIN
jgi:hypothetical protein